MSAKASGQRVSRCDGVVVREHVEASFLICGLIRGQKKVKFLCKFPLCPTQVHC